MSITKEMTVADVLKMDRTLAVVFKAQGLACLGCPSASMESIEQAAKVHKIDPDTLVDALNQQHQS